MNPSSFPAAGGTTHVVDSNDSWAAAVLHGRRGDRIVVLTWAHPRSTRGLRYTITRVGPGLTGPEPVARVGNHPGAWSPVVPS